MKIVKAKKNPIQVSGKVYTLFCFRYKIKANASTIILVYINYLKIYLMKHLKMIMVNYLQYVAATHFFNNNNNARF
jgi:hypothetical protein